MATVLDIETIPSQKTYEQYQIELYEKRLKSELKYQGLENSTDTEAIEAAERKVKSLNPFLGEIICICLYLSTEEKQITLIGNETDILKNFWNAIIDETQFIHFNGLNFDVPWIIIRSILLKIRPPRINGRNHPFLSKPRFYTFPHCDIAEWSSEWKSMYRMTLGGLCEAVGIESPKKAEVKADNVAEYFAAGKIDLIAEYCMKDVMCTYKLAQKWNYYLPNQLK